MQRVDCGVRLSGFSALEEQFDAVRDDDRDVEFDLRSVVFVEPVGFGKLCLLASTLRGEGYIVSFMWPETIAAYLRRSGMIRILDRAGFAVPGDADVPNEGGAVTLLECSHIRTDRSGRENAGAIDAARFRQFLAQNAIRSERGAQAWMEISSNAAEHAEASPAGAFVLAQAWPARGDLQIAVVDDGMGIPRSLRDHGFANDCEAVRGAIESMEVSGRRDAGGHLTHVGGYGLPTVAGNASGLVVRSGGCFAYGYRARSGRAGIRLAARAARPVRGTLVGANLTFDA